jgi:2-polyprenyl-6-methoxyphenol hydroxylase-like FAD-dependent oxidoreductase
MTRPHTAPVIGGSTAGPVAATALCQAGLQATVLEAHPSSAQGSGAS